jgi:hypothetical protein
LGWRRLCTKRGTDPTPVVAARKNAGGRAKKPRVPKFGDPRRVGSNLSRECDGGVALRRVGIEGCLALLMSDPDPQSGFGTSVGNVC